MRLGARTGAQEQESQFESINIVAVANEFCVEPGPAQ
jgi:hypothetical protein